MKNDKVYIDQILDSIRKIELFVNGVDKENFLENSLVQSAVIMQLTLIGEVSKKISDDLKKKVALPWKEIAGFRDKAIHNYFDINLDVVWDTIAIDLPPLKEGLQKIS
ncbi:MAG: hypothetical protein A3C50_02905 [Candidatus Staskawiczbacteria bacterium RIFCSPHIGHO2_02_FULL_43_16]|uniref:DUF86 domain-containing protein n=1 Tax=Candidatus Staskawiczbacteria bacterium RIFCSPHIGHO2_01_FULL_41_41 TaxID=1802203 RepID=A0A1G2HUN5_9BACT|nr:MAG: hypothetical protein A2822_03525 [Candidatus Staskawiczbacteria bacterium RIFCSPHIGHO2_01_FULL_41_41]OGZ68229.1 MAG: hypothetical protein A3C50_02905 [Candidatus Staskawiczbacteria bacterium RIFCSPHIGHO2_02_FULL_43_16]OGZ75018.1 MAG: hypothetical protein A3A12_04305 [Candidatus Staskawiczbacteria bacterium RIFCSPLOWO2_01_FULL_43_17b]